MVPLRKKVLKYGTLKPSKPRNPKTPKKPPKSLQTSAKAPQQNLSNKGTP